MLEDTQWIELSNGKPFRRTAPVWDINVVAGSLSKLCRYTGHCKAFYSVAEHSVLVAKLMEDLSLGDPLEGLLHDAGESILSDIASPWKELLPDYKKLEGEIDLSMRLAFGLPVTKTDGCKRADWLALFIEARALIPSKGDNWTAPDYELKDTAERLSNKYPIYCFDPNSAEYCFATKYNVLAKGRSNVRAA